MQRSHEKAIHDHEVFQIERREETREVDHAIGTLEQLEREDMICDDFLPTGWKGSANRWKESVVVGKEEQNTLLNTNDRTLVETNTKRVLPLFGLVAEVEMERRRTQWRRIHAYAKDTTNQESSHTCTLEKRL